MSDDPVASLIHTENGMMHFQEYWIAHRGERAVDTVEFRGSSSAEPAPGVLEALEDTVVIGPSNPVTSIGPMLALPGFADALAQTTVVAVSPFLGDDAFRPAGPLMEAVNAEPSTAGQRVPTRSRTPSSSTRPTRPSSTGPRFERIFGSTPAGTPDASFGPSTTRSDRSSDDSDRSTARALESERRIRRRLGAGWRCLRRRGVSRQDRDRRRLESRCPKARRTRGTSSSRPTRSPSSTANSPRSRTCRSSRRSTSGVRRPTRLLRRRASAGTGTRFSRSTPTVARTSCAPSAVARRFCGTPTGFERTWRRRPTPARGRRQGRAEVPGVDLPSLVGTLESAGAAFVHVDAMDSESVIEDVADATGCSSSRTTASATPRPSASTSSTARTPSALADRATTSGCSSASARRSPSSSGLRRGGEGIVVRR